MKPARHKRSLGLRFSKLSLKIAQYSLLIVAPLFAVGYLLGWFSVVWVPIVLALCVAVIVYPVSYFMLARRVELARVTLKQVRKHQFDNIEAAHLPRGDELNALIWQVYRTGLAMEKEIQELSRMEDYRKEFLGNVSHELKTPIFAIQGFTETLLNGAVEDERVNRTFLEKILRNTERLLNLVLDLSEISRIETGQLKMTMEPFSLSSMVREVFEGLESVAAQKKVRIESYIDNQLPRVLGDRQRLQQVMVNLVDNAIKYSNSGGHVEVFARALPTGRVKVTVADDGIGIASEHISRITERFYRVDSSRSRAQGGTGLGLAIVKHILGAHDTKMDLDSAPGKGSTFGFSLQIAPDPSRAETPESLTQPVNA